MKRKPWEPEQIFSENEAGRTFKAGLGRHGLYEQNKTNERFYVGDQWYGARCGNDRPLVRHNVIKRIGDYKMAVVSANPVTVNYSAEGVPNTLTVSYTHLEGSGGYRPRAAFLAFIQTERRR